MCINELYYLVHKCVFDHLRLFACFAKNGKLYFNVPYRKEHQATKSIELLKNGETFSKVFNSAGVLVNTAFWPKKIYTYHRSNT